MVIVGVLIVGIGACRAVYSFFECSSPTPEELEAQRTFIQARLSDASDFELRLADCDDNGAGYVYFTTELTPARAEDALLTSADCWRDSNERSDDAGVLCASGRHEVYVFFESTAEGTTRGELYID